MPCGGRSAPFGFVMGQRQESLAADAASTEAVVRMLRTASFLAHPENRIPRPYHADSPRSYVYPIKTDGSHLQSVSLFQIL
mgnify:CR=1 FL=1